MSPNNSFKQKTDDCQEIEDPAEYLFTKKTYNDIYCTVTHSVTGQVEIFGAISSHLAAHSTVFRKMIEERKTDNIDIPIITPEVFKLVLIHIYGGQLPQMDGSTAAEIFLNANVYKIHRLVDKACDLLLPATVEQLFPALSCVACGVTCPDLEHRVTKLIQDETDALLTNNEFLDLDIQCLVFIAKQEKLSVAELDLWKALIKWAQNKVELDTAKTARHYLNDVLQHVRLASMSQDEIIKEVMPTNILTMDELTKLLTAVTNKQVWQMPGLCSNYRKRVIIAPPKVPDLWKACSEDDVFFRNSCVFDSKLYDHHILLKSFKKLKSSFTIKTFKSVKIEAFTVRSMPRSAEGSLACTLNCCVTVSKVEGGILKGTFISRVEGLVATDEEIDLHVKLPTGQSLILSPKAQYLFGLEFTHPHLVYKILRKGQEVLKVVRNDVNNMSIKWNTTLPHVLKIKYRV